MVREIELKLEVSGEGARAIEAAGLMPDEGVWAELHAIYFDTPEHDLRRNGFSLRIRRSGQQHIQTIKADGAQATGLFTRSEWELPAHGAKPLADKRTPVPDLLGSRFAELAPVFEVPVLRRIWRIAFEETEIELTLDQGEVRAFGRQEPFCEIELELLRGSDSALFDLARRIDMVVPVRLGALSKAERGYRLLEALPTGFRADKVQLHLGMDLPEAFSVIVQSCLHQYRLNEDILLGRRVPEAVHQARVGLRRLRACLSVFRDLSGDAQAQRISRQLRSLAVTLGDARDLDVLLLQAAPGPMRGRIATARRTACRSLERTLASQKTRGLMLDLSEWLATGNWRTDPATESLRQIPPRQFAAETLERQFRKLRKRGRNLASIDEESRHRVRRNAKKLRYAAEFFTGLFPAKPERRRYKKFIARLQRLQDDLGALNDKATAERKLLSLGLSTTGDCAEFFSAWDEEALLESAENAFRKLIDIEPFWR